MKKPTLNVGLRNRWKLLGICLLMPVGLVIAATQNQLATQADLDAAHAAIDQLELAIANCDNANAGPNCYQALKQQLYDLMELHRFIRKNLYPDPGHITYGDDQDPNWDPELDEAQKEDLDDYEDRAYDAHRRLAEETRTW